MNPVIAISRLAALALLGTAPGTAALSVSELSSRAADVIQAAALAAHPGANVAVEMQPLDPRLNFPDCPDLVIKVQGSPIGRASALARCSGPHPWSATLPARVGVSMPVVVLTRPLSRGAVIMAGDIKLARRDLGDLRGQYLMALTDALGAEAKRDLDVDAALAPRHLKVPLAVKRGDQVSIVSQQGMVIVHATGIALDHGMQGDQISVRNNQSERVIRVWVVGPGQVRSGSAPPPA